MNAFEAEHDAAGAGGAGEGAARDGGVRGTGRRGGGVWGLLTVLGSDIKLSHSVFALPFAVMAAVMGEVARAEETGAWGWGGVGMRLGLVVVCMVVARTWAMLVNRVADRRFDAANPRTAGRALPTGRMSVKEAATGALVSAGVFVLAACGFGVWDGNWWPGVLSVPVLLWIGLYSFTKRWTWLCHVFLGGALAASPLAAGVAVWPGLLVESSALWWMCGMVLMWVAGFDVIYALQDIEFDRGAGLRSIPAWLGWGGAVWVSRGFHAAAWVMLVMAWRAEERFGWVFGAGVMLVGVLLVVEHAVLAARGRRGLEMAFFTVNGVVSCVLGAAGVVDLLR